MARKSGNSILYLNLHPEKNMMICYGIDLGDFLKCLPQKSDKVLLLEPELSDSEYYNNLQITTIAAVQNYLIQIGNRIGDLCWIDIGDPRNVEKLNPSQIAELLYLGKMFEPVSSPFIDIIGNNYVYLSHDNGWMLKLYSKFMNSFLDLISNKIINTVSSLRARKVFEFSNQTKNKIFKLAESGLIIDFNNINFSQKIIEVPIYCIGKYIDMDIVIGEYRRIISCAESYARLYQSNSDWKIDME